MDIEHKKVIITGAPGAGKTTLINALSNKGFHCLSEISREVIRDSLHAETDILPWGNINQFSEEVLNRMIQQYESLKHIKSKHVFCDRAIPDIISYLKFGEIPVNKKYYDAINRASYLRLVFIAPPWEEIYINDDERKENFLTAKKIFIILRKVYQSAGFHLLEIPRTTVDKRVNFVLKNLG